MISTIISKGSIVRIDLRSSRLKGDRIVCCKKSFPGYEVIEPANKRAERGFEEVKE